MCRRATWVEIVAPETLSFPQQVALFSQAAVIAGAHGAGFSNMAFASPGTRIIELIGPRGDREQFGSLAVYRQLAKMMRFDFIRCVGSSDEHIPVENGHLPLEAFTVDPRAFAGTLERLL
jgi:Glycosyltransferase 61